MQLVKSIVESSSDMNSSGGESEITEVSIQKVQLMMFIHVWHSDNKVEGRALHRNMNTL